MILNNINQLIEETYINNQFNQIELIINNNYISVDEQINLILEETNKSTNWFVESMRKLGIGAAAIALVIKAKMLGPIIAFGKLGLKALTTAKSGTGVVLISKEQKFNVKWQEEVKTLIYSSIYSVAISALINTLIGLIVQANAAQIWSAILIVSAMVIMYNIVFTILKIVIQKYFVNRALSINEGAVLIGMVVGCVGYVIRDMMGDNSSHNLAHSVIAGLLNFAFNADYSKIFGSEEEQTKKGK
ncbi:MAG: hypothetical protein H7836_12465 [Magnetococcus sp. YQC-3]